jgi:hypothetical protein
VRQVRQVRQVRRGASGAAGATGCVRGGECVGWDGCVWRRGLGPRSPSVIAVAGRWGVSGTQIADELTGRRTNAFCDVPKVLVLVGRYQILRPGGSEASPCFAKRSKRDAEEAGDFRMGVPIEASAMFDAMDSTASSS